MFMFMISSSVLIMTISCLIAISPISLGVIILFLAMFIAMQISLISSTWFGFITFIIYVGGMLVMFAYFAALQPNQLISSLSFAIAPPLVIMSIITMFNKTSMSLIISSPSVSNLFYKLNSPGLILLAMLLFLALIAVVKTSHAYKGPLRPFSYV